MLISITDVLTIITKLKYTSSKTNNKHILSSKNMTKFNC